MSALVEEIYLKGWQLDKAELAEIPELKFYMDDLHADF